MIQFSKKGFIFSIFGLLFLGTPTIFATSYEWFAPIPVNRQTIEMPVAGVKLFTQIDKTIVAPYDYVAPGEDGTLPLIKQDTAEIRWLCMSPKQDTASLVHIVKQLPRARHIGDWHDLGTVYNNMYGYKLSEGYIDGTPYLMKLVQTYALAGDGLFPRVECLWDVESYSPTDWTWTDKNADDTVNYRIQYPVGTVIWAHTPSPFSPLRKVPITWNYASEESYQSGDDFIPGSRDPFLGVALSTIPCGLRSIDPCTTTITAITLSGKHIEISYPNPAFDAWLYDTYGIQGLEYFPVPLDTAVVQYTLHSK